MRDVDRLTLDLDLRIDPMNLDGECHRQTTIYSQWSERVVDARRLAEQCGLALKVVEARLQARIRRDPTKYGIARESADAVKAAAHAHPKYVRAAQAVIDADADLASYATAISALEVKRRMLDDLITLHGQSYFAAPTGAKDRTLAQRQRKFAAAREDELTAQMSVGLRKHEPKPSKKIKARQNRKES